MTIEPPKGLKQALLRAYLGFDEEWLPGKHNGLMSLVDRLLASLARKKQLRFNSCDKPREFHKMLPSSSPFIVKESKRQIIAGSLAFASSMVSFWSGVDSDQLGPLEVLNVGCVKPYILLLIPVVVSKSGRLERGLWFL